jgi:hypothetical protein
VFQYDKAIFNEFESRDQQPAREAVDETIDKNLFLHVVVVVYQSAGAVWQGKPRYPQITPAC